MSCRELQWVAVSCSELPWVAMDCNELQCVSHPVSFAVSSHCRICILSLSHLVSLCTASLVRTWSLLFALRLLFFLLSRPSFLYANMDTSYANMDTSSLYLPSPHSPFPYLTLSLFSFLMFVRSLFLLRSWYHTCIFIYMWVYIYFCDLFRSRTSPYVCICMYVHIYINTFTRTYEYMHIHINLYLYIYIHRHIYINICIYIHKYIYIYMYIYICICICIPCDVLRCHLRPLSIYIYPSVSLSPSLSPSLSLPLSHLSCCMIEYVWTPCSYSYDCTNVVFLSKLSTRSFSSLAIVPDMSEACLHASCLLSMHAWMYVWQEI